MNKAPISKTIAEGKPPLRRRILLIDDRRDMVLTMQRMLELEGHEVHSAADGAGQVLPCARQLMPDVILCDIGLPGEISGYDVATAIRSDPICRGAYLVAVSGYGEEEDRLKARQAGFDYHLTKPVMKNKLDETVAKMPRFKETEKKPSDWPGLR